MCGNSEEPRDEGAFYVWRGFGVWSAEKKEMCASDSNPKLPSVGGTHTDEMPRAKGRKRLLTAVPRES